MVCIKITRCDKNEGGAIAERVDGIVAVFDTRERDAGLFRKTAKRHKRGEGSVVTSEQENAMRRSQGRQPLIFLLRQS